MDKNNTILGFNEYTDKDVIIHIRLTPGGPGSTSYELSILGDGTFSYIENSSHKPNSIHNSPKKGKIKKETIDLIFAEAKRIDYAKLIAGCTKTFLENDEQATIIKIWGYQKNSSTDKCTHKEELSNYNTFVFDVLNNEIGIDKTPTLSPQLPQMSRIIMGYSVTTNYGGSIPLGAPNTRYYTDYDVLKETNETTKKEFYTIMKGYLDNTMVNESITLRAYLVLQYNNDEAKLKEIHDKRPTQAKGNSIVKYPALLFHGGLAEPTFVLHPKNIELKGMGISSLNLFLEKHAKQFSSELPEDEFYIQYYSNIH